VIVSFIREIDIGRLTFDLPFHKEPFIKNKDPWKIEDEGNDKPDKPSKLKQNTPKRSKCHISPQTV
jgi:hypothetical protein